MKSKVNNLLTWADIMKSNVNNLLSRAEIMKSKGPDKKNSIKLQLFSNWSV